VVVRIGILTDIHGDVATMRRVIDHLERQGVDRLICLGDLVVHGTHPNEVVDFFRVRPEIPVIKGNHDIGATICDTKLDGLKFFSTSSRDNTLACRATLTDENRAYLAELPPQRLEGSVLYTHATIVPPSDENRARLSHLLEVAHDHPHLSHPFIGNPFGLLRHPDAVSEAFETMPAGTEIVIAGHTHRTRVHHWPAGKAVWCTDQPAEAGTWETAIELVPGDRYIINVGCTAQLKYDFLPPICAVFEPENRVIRFHQLEDLRGPMVVDWTGK
jgi:predicted phosphodiesterase